MRALGEKEIGNFGMNSAALEATIGCRVREWLVVVLRVFFYLPNWT